MGRSTPILPICARFGSAAFNGRHECMTRSAVCLPCLCTYAAELDDNVSKSAMGRYKCRRVISPRNHTWGLWRQGGCTSARSRLVVRWRLESSAMSSAFCTGHLFCARECRFEVVEVFFAGEGGYKEPACRFGAKSSAPICDWVKRYLKGGEDAFVQHAS